MNKYVVLTRPSGENTFLKEHLVQKGYMVYELPSIYIMDNELSQQDATYLQTVSSFDWIIFTSANGVHHFMKKLQQLSIDASSLRNIRIGAIGPATAKMAGIYGLSISFQPTSYISSAIPKEIGDIGGKKILLPRADIASKDLQVQLEKLGAQVTNIPIYKTVEVTDTDDTFIELVKRKRIGAISFTSSSTVKGFMKRISAERHPEILSFPVYCIGPVTAHTAKEVGFQNIRTADVYTLDGLLNIILAFQHE